MPVAGGAPTVLATRQGSAAVDLFAIDAANVYWGESSNKIDLTLLKMPLSGGTPITLAAKLAPSGRLVLDASNAYWAHGDDLNATGVYFEDPTAGRVLTVLDARHRRRERLLGEQHARDHESLLERRVADGSRDHPERNLGRAFRKRNEPLLERGGYLQRRDPEFGSDATSTHP